MENEVWKKIKDYEDFYEVSNMGRIRRIKTGRILKDILASRGYVCVTLFNKNGKKTHKIHQLVAIAFLGYSPCGMKKVVDHINFDKKDNRVGNLRIVSQRQNASHLINHGSSKYVGVSFHKHIKRWRSTIKINGKAVHLGYFDDEISASNAYQKALKKLYSEN